MLESCLSTCEVLMYDSLYGFAAEIDIIYLEEISVSHKCSDDAPGSLNLFAGVAASLQ